MMKKLLALVVVLAMVGFANAGLMIEVGGGKASVVGAVDADQYLILTGGNGAVLSNFALGAAAPSLSGPFMSAADFEALGVGYTAPAGFAGESYVFASSPGEAYKQGAYMMADLALGKTTGMGQELRSEWILEGCDPGYHKLRTWYEALENYTGDLSLSTFSEITGETLLANELKINNTAVVGETFVDGACELIPEPMTLSLLGLGALILRRRS